MVGSRNRLICRLMHNRSRLIGRLMHNHRGRLVGRWWRGRLVIDRSRRMVDRGGGMNNWSMNNRSGFIRSRGRMVRSRSGMVRGWGRVIGGRCWVVRSGFRSIWCGVGQGCRCMNLGYRLFIPSISVDRLRSSMWLASN